MVHLITGYAGEEHIQSADQGSFNASFFGTGQYVMEAGSQMEASITSNNNVRILDGDILMMGRHIRIPSNTYEDVNITTGTAGVNRNDLIVMEYSKDAGTGVETAQLKVIKGAETEGTATDPAFVSGDILAGDTLNQMPLYSVRIEGVVLADVVPLFETIPTYQALAERYATEFRKACESHLESLNILDTMEEVSANTQANQLAGALAVKELAVQTEEVVAQVSENLNVRYNEETDTLQIYFGGEWLDWKSANIQGYTLLKNGTITENGYVAYSEAYAFSKFENGVIKVGSTNTSTCHFCFALKDQIAFGGYTKLIINVSTYGKAINVYSITSLPTNYSLPAGSTNIGVIYNAGTIEFDLTNISTLGYIAFNNNSTGVVGETWIDSVILK